MLAERVQFSLSKNRLGVFHEAITLQTGKIKSANRPVLQVDDSLRRTAHANKRLAVAT